MKNFLGLLLLSLIISTFAFAQDKTSGGVKGKVRDTKGKTVSGVLVQAKQGDKEIASARTDGKGDFTIVGLKPETYNLVFTKSGLSEGTLSKVEVKPKTVVTLKRLVMSVDQGTLAIVRGSVFDQYDKSVYGAKVEISKVNGNESEKIAATTTGESGEFTFRLPPNAANYRVSVTIKGAQSATKTLEINGAQIYNIAVSLKPVVEVK
ncbi:MAG: carboxypeptidase regulatory-like domain-containing protein [Pyrinomonadaceae bacterium]|nr:carboxypeptidase regulatory-like domain-containing protein [Pyrinomonadaceae bacterium]